MKILRFVMGDQLTHDLSSLNDLNAATDIVLMVEVADECNYVPHHKQKIVLFLSAMRHFAAELRERGIAVDYVNLKDTANTGTFTSEVARAIERHAPSRIVVTEPGEWRVQKMIENWGKRFHIPVEIRTDDRFFASKARFDAWVNGRHIWRMEHFYRDMRREHGILMDGESPVGGQWNFDQENRKRMPTGMPVPRRRRFAPDDNARALIALVSEQFATNFGTLDEFGWPVTRAQALKALRDFIDAALPSFGTYQDAMKAGAYFLFHSLLSPALNIGLLSPREICAAAESAWRDGRVPINAAEGLIRQILGWREYVRGVYWSLMPGYADSNTLDAHTPLPDFYWTGETKMRCLREVVTSTRKYGYSHHIQRLMVTGNFALLAGIAPREIERWYLAVYVDALQWVEMPNTLGMAVFADGGKIASKPYAASGAYINRMSNFCSQCTYDVTLKSGPRACPFNILYWAFLIRNERQLSGNVRMTMPYRTLAQWNTKRKEEYLNEAARVLKLCSGKEV